MYELLAPAGNLDKLKVALLYGADAVFIGGKSFSLRAKANNFTLEEIKEAVIFAHNLQKKVHVTVNIIPSESELQNAKEYLLKLDEIGVDAVIVTSPALIEFIKQKNLNLEIHISTQCSTSNHFAVKFYEKMGAKRVVLARECSIDDIEKIINNTSLEIETFIHGGLCSSVSGRCHLSDFFTGRKANKGLCAHSCRWSYEIDDNKAFLFGCKDLCTIPFFDKLLDLKISSFKIEGRMKSLHYIASVVRAYRRYIDDYLNNTLNKETIEFCYNELSRCESRNYGTSFFKGCIEKKDMVEFESKEANNEFVGFLRIKDNKVILTPKTLITKDQTFEMIQPNKMTNTIIKVTKLILNGEEVEDTRHVKTDLEACFDKDVLDYSILRKKIDK